MKIIPKIFDNKDIEHRVNWINDPRINSSMFFDLPASIENTLKWYENNIGNFKRVDFSFKNEEGILIAMGGFTNIQTNHGNAEFYIMVHPDMHGQGIGKRVSTWMYNYAFSVINLHKIYLYTNDNNIAAYKIYENSGFKLEGILREHKVKNNLFQNRRFYGLLKKEWHTMDWKKDVSNEL